MRDDLAVRIATALETIAVNTTPADTGTTETPAEAGTSGTRAETTGETKTTKGGTK